MARYKVTKDQLERIVENFVMEASMESKKAPVKNMIPSQAAAAKKHVKNKMSGDMVDQSEGMPSVTPMKKKLSQASDAKKHMSKGMTKHTNKAKTVKESYEDYMGGAMGPQDTLKAVVGALNKMEGETSHMSGNYSYMDDKVGEVKDEASAFKKEMFDPSGLKQEYKDELLKAGVMDENGMVDLEKLKAVGKKRGFIEKLLLRTGTASLAGGLATVATTWGLVLNNIISQGKGTSILDIALPFVFGGLVVALSSAAVPDSDKLKRVGDYAEKEMKKK